MTNEFWAERPIRARKQHTCDSCFQTIAQGEEHTYGVGRVDYDFTTYRTHRDCRTVELALWELGGSHPYDETKRLMDFEQDDVAWCKEDFPETYQRVFAKGSFGVEGAGS